MIRRPVYLLIIYLFLSGCIGTDIIEDMIDEALVINTRITGIKVGETVIYKATYFDNVGEPMPAEIEWTSSNESVITINNKGEATALAVGNANIVASHKDLLDEIGVEAGDETVEDDTERKATLTTTSSYPLVGTAILRKDNGELFLDLLDDFSTTSDLPGLYVYLTNNVSNVSGAVGIGKVVKFTGAQTYPIPGNPGLYDFNYILFYCKPFAVPVGNGKWE